MQWTLQNGNVLSLSIKTTYYVFSHDWLRTIGSNSWNPSLGTMLSKTCLKIGELHKNKKLRNGNPLYLCPFKFKGDLWNVPFSHCRIFQGSRAIKTSTLTLESSFHEKEGFHILRKDVQTRSNGLPLGHFLSRDFYPQFHGSVEKVRDRPKNFNGHRPNCFFNQLHCEGGGQRRSEAVFLILALSLFLAI